MTTKLLMTYADFDRHMDNLITKLGFNPMNESQDVPWEYVYGIPRGGVAVALHISHFLGIDMLSEHELNSLPLIDKRNVLVVDDVADTGQTLTDMFIHHGIDFATATIYYKPSSVIKPDYYSEETDKWVVFPWERTNEEPNREGY